MEKSKSCSVFSYDDVSSFFLIEASGDSEVVDSSYNEVVVDLAEDDAESCSFDAPESECHSSATDLNSNGRRLAEEEEEEEEEEVNQVYQTWEGNGKIGLEMNQKSCASVDSTEESLNEMEKSRLFWEACLAS